MTGPPTSASTRPRSGRAWEADPYRRHELRFRDGELWTEHVADRGVPGIDTTPVADLPRSHPPDRTAGVVTPPVAAGPPVRVVPSSGAAHGLLDARVLVVDEPSIAVHGRHGSERTVHDEHDRPLATIRVGRESVAARGLRMLTTAPRPEVAEVDVFDPTGMPLLSLDRPAHLMKQVVVVKGPGAAVIGRIIPRRMLQSLQLDLEVDDVVVGHVVAERVGDPLLRAIDPGGRLLARISTEWEVPAARHHPTSGTHLVLVEEEMAEPLRSMVLAALLALDVMLVPSPVES